MGEDVKQVGEAGPRLQLVQVDYHVTYERRGLWWRINVERRTTMEVVS